MINVERWIFFPLLWAWKGSYDYVLIDLILIELKIMHNWILNTPRSIQGPLHKVYWQYRRAQRGFCPWEAIVTAQFSWWEKSFLWCRSDKDEKFRSKSAPFLMTNHNVALANPLWQIKWFWKGFDIHSSINFHNLVNDINSYVIMVRCSNTSSI